MIFFSSYKFHNFALQMLVVGPLFQITPFLIQFLAHPFPIFALSFSISGIGTVFQVGIVYIHKDLQIASNNAPFDSFQDASANGFIATLQRDSEYKMGCIHAAYGNTLYAINTNIIS